MDDGALAALQEPCCQGGGGRLKGGRRVGGGEGGRHVEGDPRGEGGLQHLGRCSSRGEDGHQGEGKVGHHRAEGGRLSFSIVAGLSVFSELDPSSQSWSFTDGNSD